MTPSLSSWHFDGTRSSHDDKVGNQKQSMWYRERSVCKTITTQLYVVLQFDAEFRRISLPKTDVGTYEQFRILIERLHKLIEVPFVLSYTDPKDGDLLPINNDDNLGRAVLTAKPLLRIIVQRKGKIS